MAFCSSTFSVLVQCVCILSMLCWVKQIVFLVSMIQLFLFITQSLPPNGALSLCSHSRLWVLVSLVIIVLFGLSVLKVCEKLIGGKSTWAVPFKIIVCLLGEGGMRLIIIYIIIYIFWTKLWFWNKENLCPCQCSLPQLGASLLVMALCDALVSNCHVKIRFKH